MTNRELLKEQRDLLLKLHKSFIDQERVRIESRMGTLTPGQFLNLLLEDPDFSWLRKFSELIVAIDELFAQKDAIAEADIDAHLSKVKGLVLFEEGGDDFLERYQTALQENNEAVALQGELRQKISA